MTPLHRAEADSERCSPVQRQTIKPLAVNKLLQLGVRERHSLWLGHAPSARDVAGGRGLGKAPLCSFIALCVKPLLAALLRSSLSRALWPGAPVSSSSQPWQRWCWSCKGRRGTGGSSGRGLRRRVLVSRRSIWRERWFSFLSGNTSSWREVQSGSGSLLWEPAALGFIVSLPTLLVT